MLLSVATSLVLAYSSKGAKIKKMSGRSYKTKMNKTGYPAVMVQISLTKYTNTDGYRSGNKPAAFAFILI